MGLELGLFGLSSFVLKRISGCLICRESPTAPTPFDLAQSREPQVSQETAPHLQSTVFCSSIVLFVFQNCFLVYSWLFLVLCLFSSAWSSCLFPASSMHFCRRNRQLTQDEDEPFQLKPRQPHPSGVNPRVSTSSVNTRLGIVATG